VEMGKPQSPKPVNLTPKSIKVISRSNVQEMRSRVLSTAAAAASSASRASHLPAKVRIVESGARDGLQNVKKSISAEDKVQFITMLERAGLRYIEAGSFVSPKWVPQVRIQVMEVLFPL
jgi:hypothetical protein